MYIFSSPLKQISMTQEEVDEFVASTVPDIVKDYFLFTDIESASDNITFLGTALETDDALAIFNDAYHYHTVRKHS